MKKRRGRIVPAFHEECKNADAIAAAVLATSMAEGDAPAGAYAKEWSINGEPATLSVRKNG